MRGAALMGLVAVSLAACTGTGDWVVYPPDLNNYRSGIADWAARNGELLAEIHGAPFGSSVPDEAIANAVPVPPWVARRMTTTPSPGTPKDYRVVLNFGPAFAGHAGNAACTGGAGLPSRAVTPGERIPLLATYCVFNEAMAAIRGTGPVATGPEDRGFRNFMYVMLAGLLPGRDPNWDGPCDPLRC